MKIALVLAGAALVVVALRFRPPAAEPAFTVVRAAPSASPQHATAAAPHRSPSPAPIVVYVTGAVAHPGLVTLPSGARADLAVRHAGGLAPGADATAVNLAEHVRDGEEIVVPREGERVSNATHAHRASRSSSGAVRGARRSTPGMQPQRRHRSKQTTPAEVVHINSATVDTLAAIPGIGTRLAERIVEFRDLNGPFDSLDELADIEGFSDRKLDVIAPYVTL